jgi:hypothetical protein
MAQMSDSVEIVFHPAKKHPVKAALLGFVLGIAFQALWQALDPLTAVALTLLLLATVRDFYLETHYRFDAEGVAVRGLLKASRTYPWKRFRAYIEDRNGLFLTPYLARRRLESQRGVFLPMTAPDRRLAANFCAALELTRRAA